MLLGSIQFGDLRHNVAFASHGPAFNIGGWIWADPIGWISTNSDNVGACATPPCGSYGLQLDTVTRKLKGFAWNDAVGWICFGESCAAVSASCGSVPPFGTMEAHIDPPPVLGTLAVHGWANVCNQKEKGWISLNCADASTCGSAYPYRVKYVTGSGFFGNPTPPPPLESYAWNGNSDGTGFGYMDFKNVRIISSENMAAGNCADGIDNNLNGKIDCQDTGCSADLNCLENNDAKCSDGIDNNLNGLIDCQEALCRSDGFGGCALSEAGKCLDGKDNDGNGLIDCADSACAAFMACLPPSGSEPTLCVGGSVICCHDGKDNDGADAVPPKPANGKDCDDLQCQKFELSCLPAKIDAKYGSVYSKGSISVASGTASFCLTTLGTISSGFKSGSGCKEEGPSSPSYSFPSGSGGYKGTLGSLDVAGILAGHYGVVTTHESGVISLDSILGGKVYRVVGDATLGATTLKNGSGTTRGDGLLIVEGDLTITGDVAYATEDLPKSIRNLASFGVIVKKKEVGGGGGNIKIDPSVRKLSGAFFVEDTVQTGTTGGLVDPTRLEVFGLMAARRFKLERKFRSQIFAAETFVFDGRAVANPPPGMSEIGKALPTPKDAF